MKIDPYLSFDGRCEEAFKFYEKVLGAKIGAMFPWGETPAAEQVPAEWRTKIIHGRLLFGDKELMGCDAPPESYKKPQGVSMSIQLNDPAEAESLFNKLAENGTVDMPIQQTFWAVRFGMLTDQFGIPWMINCEEPGK